MYQISSNRRQVCIDVQNSNRLTVTNWNRNENKKCSITNIFLRLEPSQKFDFSFVLGLKTTWDLHVYIHPPGDEIWLSFAAFPHDVSYFRLDLNNSDGMLASDVAITEKEIVIRNKDSAPCKYYNDQVNFHLPLSSDKQMFTFLWP